MLSESYIVFFVKCRKTIIIAVDVGGNILAKRWVKTSDVARPILPSHIDGFRFLLLQSQLHSCHSSFPFFVLSFSLFDFFSPLFFSHYPPFCPHLTLPLTLPNFPPRPSCVLHNPLFFPAHSDHT